MYSTDSDLSDWETRRFGRTAINSPPLVGKNDQIPDSDEYSGSPTNKRTHDKYDDDDDDENDPNLTPKQRRKDSERYPGKENKTPVPGVWNSVSSRDSAIGGSLFSAYGSMLTESSSSLESQTNSEDNLSSANSSPVHSVYGRYQKLDGRRNTLDTTNLGKVENLVLHRLPGENLGMILGIEGGKSNGSVSGVFVKTVTLGGAAYRAQGSSKGIADGDEILQVNGMNVREMNYEECLTVLREMPLRVNLTVKRGNMVVSPLPAFGSGSLRLKLKAASSRDLKQLRGEGFLQNYAMTTSESEMDDEHQGLEGFRFVTLEVDKNPGESLGVSIVPSYGSTRQFYQVSYTSNISY